MKLSVAGVALCSVFVLSSCGGGGSSGSEATVNIFPVESAFTTFFSQNAIYNIGTRDAQGNNYDIEYAVMPLADEVQPDFSPDPLKRTSLTVRLAINGTPAGVDTSSLYYSAEPFLIWGTRGDVNDAVTTQTPAPATATVGDSGPLATGPYSYYDNATLQTSQSTITWSLERATPSTAWLCMNIDTTDGTGPIAESDCARINEAGEILDFRATVTGDGITLTFQ